MELAWAVGGTHAPNCRAATVPSRHCVCVAKSSKQWLVCCSFGAMASDDVTPVAPEAVLAVGQSVFRALAGSPASADAHRAVEVRGPFTRVFVIAWS